jgi:hypothetical protein
MRVRSSLFSAGGGFGASDACTPFITGETEDYQITINSSAGGGCLGNFNYPIGTIAGPVNVGQTVAITSPSVPPCNYSGDYTNIALGVGKYSLNSSIATDYFTLTDLSNSVYISSVQPMNFTVNTATTIRSHLFSSSSCIADQICRYVSITKVPNFTLPSVSTNTVTAITGNSATCGGNVSAAGSASVTSRGVCYASTSNPTIANSTVSSGTGIGTFSVNLSGLTPSTIYHVRAFATSSVGTSYGSDITFTTLSSTSGCIATIQYPGTLISGPTTNGQTVVVTNPINTCNYSGEFGEIALGNGNYTLTSSNTNDYFVVTDQSNAALLSGSQPLNFSITNAGTYRYHIFSNMSCIPDQACRGVSITKNGSGLALLTSSVSVSSVGATTASSGGNISSAGGSPISSRGVCYDVSATPTLANTIVSGGSGSGSFVCNITGLTPNTTYYLRAFATNNSGTAYGNEISFTTATATTIHEMTSSIPITVSPNPFTDEIIVSSKGRALKSQFVITNLLGMIVYEGILDGEISILSLEKLASGIYSLKIMGEQGIKISKK